MINNLNELSQEELKLLLDYIKHFNIHYNLLLERYEHFKNIDDVSRTLDANTYFDMIIVQIRALCIENPRNKKNYTAQILLQKLGHNDMAEKLDEMLDLQFSEALGNMNIRTALKELADKFICHYDNFDGENMEGWGYGVIIEKFLRNPHMTPNIHTIMDTLINCIGKALSVD